MVGRPPNIFNDALSTPVGLSMGSALHVICHTHVGSQTSWLSSHGYVIRVAVQNILRLMQELGGASRLVASTQVAA